MITPLKCQEVLDLTKEPLKPGWFRCKDTRPDMTEMPAPGLWRTGPDARFRAALIRAMEYANETILVCAFLFADEELANAMLDAYDRGVRIYVLTASEQRIGKLLRDDDEFGQRMAKDHERLLNSLAGKVLLRSAEHFHAKFLVVDHNDQMNASAFISTANFNRALTENIELGVELSTTTARELASYFNWAFWCEAELELKEKGRLLPISQPPRNPIKPGGNKVFATLKESLGLRDTVLSMIQSARREILLATYGMDLDHVVTKALIEAIKNGVQVTVLTRPRPAMSSTTTALSSAGAKIFAHDKMHAKALVSDGKALVLSANIEANGLDQGFEVGALLPEYLAEEIEATLRDWATNFPWVFKTNAIRGSHLGDYLPADKGLRDGVIRVVSHHEQPCSDQVAKDALQFDNTAPPSLEPRTVASELPQQIKFTWSVVPPKLPKKAKRRESSTTSDEHDLAIYDHADNTYVVIENDADISKARSLAQQLSAIVVAP